MNSDPETLWEEYLQALAELGIAAEEEKQAWENNPDPSPAPEVDSARADHASARDRMLEAWDRLRSGLVG